MSICRLVLMFARSSRADGASVLRPISSASLTEACAVCCAADFHRGSHRLYHRSGKGLPGNRMCTDHSEPVKHRQEPQPAIWKERWPVVYVDRVRLRPPERLTLDSRTPNPGARAMTALSVFLTLWEASRYSGHWSALASRDPLCPLANHMFFKTGCSGMVSVTSGPDRGLRSIAGNSL